MSVLFSDGGRTVVASGAALTIFEDDRTIYILYMCTLYTVNFCLPLLVYTVKKYLNDHSVLLYEAVLESF